MGLFDGVGLEQVVEEEGEIVAVTGMNMSGAWN